MSNFVEKENGTAQADGATEISKAQAPTMGSARSPLCVADKDYFTPAEVDRLSERDLSDPKTLKTVISSMKKWR